MIARALKRSHSGGISATEAHPEEGPHEGSPKIRRAMEDIGAPPAVVLPIKVVKPPWQRNTFEHGCFVFSSLLNLSFFIG